MLFSRNGLVTPIAASGTLRILATTVLLLWVVGLLVVILRTVGDPAMCSWNVTFCVVLLIPTSHITYILYGLPVLWLWGARLFMASRFRLVNGVVFGALLLWWIVEAQSWPASLRGYCIIFAGNLLACTVSAIAARRVSNETDEISARPATEDLDHQGYSPGTDVRGGGELTELGPSPSVVQFGVES